MNRRYFILLALVLTAVGLNVWFRLPAGQATRTDERRAAERWAPDAMRVKIPISTDDVPASRRDLFQPRVRIVTTAPPKVETPPPAPPVKTPQQLAEEAARAELGQMKLVGVVFRGDEGEAFMVKGDQVFIVRNGSKIGERFIVQSVSADSVSLRDPGTAVDGKISISGK